MSMTPLQVHAAAECVKVGSDAISAHKMAAIMQAYSENTFSFLIGPEIQSIVDSINDDLVLTDEEKAALIEQVYAALPPVATNSYDPSQTFLTSQLTNGGGTTFDLGYTPPFTTGALLGQTMEESVVNYCNDVLCKGDVGKFSQVIDKVSGFSANTGDVFTTIEQAQNMRFSDFGPDVSDFSGAINMGLGAVLAPVAASIREQAAKAGVSVTPAGQPDTDNVVVSTALVAQGDVTGAPGSPNYGTALGIYEQAKLKGLTTELREIHTAMVLSVGVHVTSTVPDVPASYFLVPKNTRYTFEDVLRLLAAARQRGAVDEGSTDKTIRFYGQKVREWATDTTDARLADFIGTTQEQALDILERASVGGTLTLYEEVTLDTSIRSENNMRIAIDALSKPQAQRLFNKLGARVQVSRLARNTDVLDLSKVALAQPEPDRGQDRNPEIPVEDAYKPVVDDESSAVAQVADVGSSLEVDAQGNVVVPSLGDQAAAGAASLARDVGTDLKNVGNALLQDAKDIAQRAQDAFNSLSSAVTSAPTKAKEFGQKLSNIKGFSQVAGGRALTTVVRGVETQFPVSNGGTAIPPTLLSGITSVMPQSVVDQFKSVLQGGGSNADGSFKLRDFLGSVVGLNQQEERWAQITALLNKLGDEYGSSLSSDLAAEPDFESKIAILGNFWALYGAEVDSVYAATMQQMGSEWQKLTQLAEVSYSQLRAASINSAIGFAKKLAQHANKLDSGVAEIIQLAADPTTQGGQILLGVMVEARNIRLLQSIGLNPINVVDKRSTPVRVTDADRDQARAIEQASGVPGSVTPEELARRRGIGG